MQATFERQETGAVQPLQVGAFLLTAASVRRVLVDDAHKIPPALQKLPVPAAKASGWLQL